MRKVTVIVVVVCAIYQLSLQAALPSDSFYTAGVVEFRKSNATAGSRVEENLSGYLELIASPQAAATDIIVFPESTLNDVNSLTFVPNPKVELISLCEFDPDAVTYHRFLVRLSCQAKVAKKYIVINVTEKEKCSDVLNDPRPCASNDLNIYNTNVVFDRDGVIISRYRKVHLYGETKNTTFIPEISHFDTDFGVRFGHFICFDILFYAPAQHMAEKLGIRDFIFPSMWFSQLPFLSGVQFQASWAFGNDVNLLAAGSSNPGDGSSGTGIYNGRNGTLVAVSNINEGKREILVTRVPKLRAIESRKLTKRDLTASKYAVRQSRLNAGDINLKRDYLQHYESVMLDDLSKDDLRTTHKVCHFSAKGGAPFCCHFEVEWEKLNATLSSRYYSYRLGAYNGSRNEAAVEDNHIRNCAIFACISDDIADCGKLLPAAGGDIQPEYVFRRVVITATYPHSDEFLIMPNSLTESLLPVEPINFNWEIEKKRSSYLVRYTLNAVTENLLTFAIYGNYYDDKNTKGGAPSVAFATSLLPGLLLCGRFWQRIF